jgi:hypothetical protein
MRNNAALHSPGVPKEGTYADFCDNPAMTATDVPPVAPPVGFCRGCGYALQGLETPRCPECGRAFDPADPKTMNMGRQAGAVARWASRPVRWGIVLGGFFVATLAIVVTTRPQLGSWREWDLAPVDPTFYVQWVAERPHLLLTWIDYVYAAGIWTWMLLVGWTLLRALLGIVARHRYHITAPPAKHRTRRFLLAMLFLLISGVCVLVGWPYRLGQHIATSYLADVSAVQGQVPLYAVGPYFPIAKGPLSDRRANEIIRAMTIQAPQPKQRIAGLAVAEVRSPGPNIAALTLEAIGHEEDPTVLEWEIRVLGLTHDRGLLQVVDRFLASPHVRLRIAALDAISVSTHASVRPDLELFSGPGVLASSPHIPIAPQFAITSSADLPVYVQYSRATEARVTEIVATTADLKEREAAARAIKAFRNPVPNAVPQPMANFRVAEWGVWIDSAGLISADEATGDIPPFVHRFGDPAAALATEVEMPLMTITKPVVHFYAPGPLVVSLGTQIRGGRIDYTFPKPDDYLVSSSWRATYSINVAPTTQPLAGLDPPPNVKPFADRRRGLPWIVRDPSSTSVSVRISSNRGLPVPRLTSIGFHWDALVVIPERQAWMQAPAVPSDPKYAWWPRLRDVPCAWVTNRGDTERFLYYDGPSQTPPTVRVSLSDVQQLRIDAPIGQAVDDDSRIDVAGFNELDGQRQTARAGRRGERRGLYIEVAGNAVSGEIVPMPTGIKPPKEPSYRLGAGERLAGPQLETTLREWIIDAGLTSAESDGLLACWRETFFRKPGKRFVMLMSAVDYDSLCPIDIRPRPQTLARVGLVWTELAPASGATTQPAAKEP